MKGFGVNPRTAFEKGYPSFSSVGGYTLIYLDNDDNVLCAECAAAEPEITTPLNHQHAYWEGPDIYCEECGATIESSYGDPETEEDNPWVDTHTVLAETASKLLSHPTTKTHRAFAGNVKSGVASWTRTARSSAST